MIYYWIFVSFCLMMYVFHHWFTGNDLRQVELFAMFVMAIFPIMNALCLIAALYDLLTHCIAEDGILLKGRK